MNNHDSDIAASAGDLARRQQALLDFAVSQSPAVFYIAALDGEKPIRFISANVEALTGHSPAAFLQEPRFGRRHIHPEDLPDYDRSLERLREWGALAQKYRFATAAGDYRWFRDELRLIREEGREEFVGCMIDITAAVEAEAQRQRLADLLQDAVESLPNGFIILDADDRMVAANSSLIQRHGFEADILAGTPLEEMVRNLVSRWRAFDGHPVTESGSSVAWITQRIREMADEAIEVELVNGEWRLMRSNPTSEGGRVVISVDVTRLKKAEIAVRESETELRGARETLKDAIESLSEGFVLYDADDRLIMCNSQYKEFHGDSADLFVPGATWPEITRKRGERGLFASAAGRVEEWLEGQIAQRGIAKNEEFEFSDGRWFEYSHRPTRQGGFVSTWREITDRREMEQALRESEDMVRHVLEACPVPITMNHADDGVIIYESPAARALLKYDEPQEGMSVISRWSRKEDRQAYLEDLRKTGAVDGREIRYKRADGEEFWCALSSRLIDYRGQEVIVSSLADLTERKAVEAEMARQRDMLHQSEKLSALGELLAGVAHEINNPLSVVVGQSLLLKETAKDEQTSDRAEKIGNAADRCARIVKSFLAMARQDPIKRQPTNVNEIVETALEVTAYTLRSSDIDVSLRFAKGLPKVMADPDQLRQVITNLLINAQHALQDVEGERKLRITTSYRKQKGLVVIKVKDNGPGIPEEIRNRIFEPLFTTKEVGIGTGIGLAVCHRIVETHGGTIAVESPPNEGAAFAVRLPTPLPGSEDGSVGNEQRDQAPGHSILVIDDEADVAELLADILRSDGHRVTIANSGREALDRISRASFDVLLTDLRMPELDGPGLFRVLQDREPDLISGIGFVTGDTMSARIKQFLESSGRPYIEKPITPAEVRALIVKLMDEKERGA
jgi:PAS domain S-box-containing protein